MIIGVRLINKNDNSRRLELLASLAQEYLSKRNLGIHHICTSVGLKAQNHTWSALSSDFHKTYQ